MGVTIATNQLSDCTYSEESIYKAIDLAQDVEQLNHLRINSRARLSKQPLFDAKQFSKDFAELMTRIVTKTEFIEASDEIA